MPRRLQTHWPNVLFACAGITAFGFSLGLTYPLLSLILEARGVAEDTIGLNAAMGPLGILLFSPVIPWLTRRIGARNLSIIAAAVSTLVMILLKVYDDLASWFVLRLLQGAVISTLFVLSEAWIIRYSSERYRGRIVAAYASVLSASFGAGPAIVSWIGIAGWAPFLIGAAGVLVSIIPLAMVREEEAAESGQSPLFGAFGFIFKAPMLLVSVFVFAIFDAATLSLLPIYGMRSGLELVTATLLLTVLIVGNTLLQFPIGWIADRIPRRVVLAGCALTTAIVIGLLPVTIGTWMQWPVLIIAGAAGYGVYTVALIALGDRFSGADLVQGASAFAITWGLGALIGSFACGQAMILFGRHGLPVSLVLIYGLLAIGIGLRMLQLRRQAQSLS